MRTLSALPLLIAVTAGAAAASDCGIDHAVETDIGPNAGLARNCSNDHEPIACSYGLDGSTSFTGPGVLSAATTSTP